MQVDILKTLRRIQVLKPLISEERFQKFLEHVVKRNRLRLVLENIGNPGNIGAALRTAEGLGVQKVHLIGSESPSTNPKIWRTITQNSSSGAAKWLSLTFHETTEECFHELKQDQYEIYCSDLHQESLLLHDLPLKPVKSPPLLNNFEIIQKMTCSSFFKDQPSDALKSFDPAPTSNHVDESSPSSKNTAFVFGNEISGISQYARESCDKKFIIPMRGLSQSYNVSCSVSMTLYHCHLLGLMQNTLCLPDQLSVLLEWLQSDVNCYESIFRKMEI